MAKITRRVAPPTEPVAIDATVALQSMHDAITAGTFDPASVDMTSPIAESDSSADVEMFEMMRASLTDGSFDPTNLADYFAGADEPAEDEPAEDEPAEDEPAEDEPAEDEPAETAIPNEQRGDATADEIRQRIDAHKDALRNSISIVNRLTAGDVTGEGYAEAKANQAPLQLSLAEMVDWYPGNDANPIESMLRDEHFDLQPETSLARYNFLSNVLFHAVCASSPDKAREARDGINPVTGKLCHYQFVRVPNLVAKVKPTDTTPVDKIGKVFVGTAAEAKAYMSAQAGAATAAKMIDEADAWNKGLAAIDNVQRLRELGDELAANAQSRKRKFRDLVYTSVIADHVDNFKNQDPSKPIGKLWTEALAKAAAAHSAVMSAASKTNSIVTVEELTAAIDSAVWVDFLEPLIGSKGKAVKDEAEELESARKALWATVARVQKKFEVRGLDEAVDVWIKTQHSDIQPLLVDPDAVKRLTAQALRDKREAIAAAKLAKEQEAQAKRDAAAKTPAKPAPKVVTPAKTPTPVVPQRRGLQGLRPPA